MWNEGIAAAARRRMGWRNEIEEEREREVGMPERGGRKENVGLVGKPASERLRQSQNGRQTGWLARTVSEIRGEVAHSYPSHHFYPITVILGVYCNLCSRLIELSCLKGSKLSKT